MEKKKITKTVFVLQSDKPILWKHLKDFKFEDDDKLHVAYIEPWENGSSNSGGDHYQAEVYRDVLETDQEFEKRKADNEREKKWLKERRYENYLKLKKEFEPNKLEENDTTGAN